MILHIDMDAFFAAVEQLDHPALKGKALVVGGDLDRGVVAAASYEARRFGIHSAMPLFMARQRCPGLIVMPPRRERYRQVSRTVMAILGRYAPVVEQVSIDEAYLDVSGCRRLGGSPATMAQAIKNEIREATALTCSIGAAPLKFLAKIASDMNKPDGLTLVDPEAVSGFIDTLPVEKVAGVGPRALQQLRQLGVTTLGAIRTIPPSLLLDRMGKFGRRLIDLAHGRDDNTVIPHAPAKSISTERTLTADTRDREQLNRHLLTQSQEVGRQLRRQGWVARTIRLKLKHTDFSCHIRSTTLQHPSQSSETIYRTATTLLDRQPLKKAVRLIGVGASTLIADTAPQQACLFPTLARKDQGWEKVDRVMDRIAERFGPGAVQRGPLGPGDDGSMD